MEAEFARLLPTIREVDEDPMVRRGRLGKRRRMSPTQTRSLSTPKLLLASTPSPPNVSASPTKATKSKRPWSRSSSPDSDASTSTAHVREKSGKGGRKSSVSFQLFNRTSSSSASNSQNVSTTPSTSASRLRITPDLTSSPENSDVETTPEPSAKGSALTAHNEREEDLASEEDEVEGEESTEGDGGRLPASPSLPQISTTLTFSPSDEELRQKVFNQGFTIVSDTIARGSSKRGRRRKRRVQRVGGTGEGDGWTSASEVSDLEGPAVSVGLSRASSRSSLHQPLPTSPLHQTLSAPQSQHLTSHLLLRAVTPLVRDRGRRPTGSTPPPLPVPMKRGKGTRSMFLPFRCPSRMRRRRWSGWVEPPVD
ncbi:hypothetical protein BT69DRAFT_67769 [Atractiella rhizophila]|nr:hypothetical protein BT69DRAFT_67769 [Atractiella rhizophila]